MEQFKAFLEKVKTDSGLMAKLDALGAKKASDDEIIALAAENGFAFTKEDIEQMRSIEPKSCPACGKSTQALSEEELECICGGGFADRHNPEICSQYKHAHYHCVGLFSAFWCIHYSKEGYIKDIDGRKWIRHKCAKNHFDYKVDALGQGKHW